MADVCLTAPAVLSPISPNERRKRRHGYDSHVSEGCGANWYKRHRTGHSFARRLLHLRGFSLNVQQADELVRFIDQFPPEMDRVRALALACPFFSVAPLSPPRSARPPRTRAAQTPGRHRSTSDTRTDEDIPILEPGTGRVLNPGEVRRHRRRHPPAHLAQADRGAQGGA